MDVGLSVWMLDCQCGCWVVSVDVGLSVWMLNC